MLLFAGPALAQQRSPAEITATAAQRAYEAARARFASGAEQLETVYLWSLRWREAERLARPNNAAQAKVAHRTRIRELCTQARAMVQNGSLPTSVDAACDYYAAEAEL
jgi:hypothetical protein